ncbi:MAG TPA: hypothetical protein VFV89_11135 [Nocardioides sp.]|uniref:hypothetical protein n=1 Tax=Nocardioides sp. TaxID=35761 RepID=UPI002E33131F|nr:hypothetical protein [Nocardioides sp.]HEX5088352.1 hypothetical protein [Nocardioides sp.]
MADLITTDACTLPTAERPLRVAEFDSLFAASATAVSRRGDGSVRIALSGGPGLVERVRDLIEREAACCSFFTFAVQGSDEELTLDVSVPPGRRDILEALAARAEERTGGGWRREPARG